MFVNVYRQPMPGGRKGLRSERPNQPCINTLTPQNMSHILELYCCCFIILTYSSSNCQTAILEDPSREWLDNLRLQPFSDFHFHSTTYSMSPISSVRGHERGWCALNSFVPLQTMSSSSKGANPFSLATCKRDCTSYHLLAACIRRSCLEDVSIAG